MEDLWREDDTTPGRIEAALRNMFAERHKEERAYVPARVMNMVVIVDKDFRGEVENRLQRVGRFHPSRLIFVNVEPGRQRLAASVRVGTVDAPKAGAISVGRERVSLLVGEKHLKKLDTIIDPILKAWAADDEPLHTYESGTAGPAAADELIAPQRWRGL